MTMPSRALRRTLLSTLLLAGGHAGAQAAPAQDTDYPKTQTRIVVTFAPGQTADSVARILAQHLTERFKQSFIVDNRPGAGGSVGMQHVARAKPDGYTLGMATIGPMSQQPYLNPALPFSPTQDFTPIGNVAFTPVVLLANKDAGINSVQDLVDRAGRHPGEINYASAGVGSNQHVAMELFKSRTNTKLEHVPFKGGSESYAALLAGTTTIMFDAIPATLPYIRNGQVKALGIADAQRSPLIPDVPTLEEAGVKDFQVLGWMGLVAPAGTPEPVLAKLNQAVQDVLNEPDVREQLLTLGFTPAPSSRESFGDLIRKENEKWSKVIKSSGIKLQ